MSFIDQLPGRRGQGLGSGQQQQKNRGDNAILRSLTTVKSSATNVKSPAPIYLTGRCGMIIEPTLPPTHDKSGRLLRPILERRPRCKLRLAAAGVRAPSPMKLARLSSRPASTRRSSTPRLKASSSWSAWQPLLLPHPSARSTSTIRRGLAVITFVRPSCVER